MSSVVAISDLPRPISFSISFCCERRSKEYVPWSMSRNERDCPSLTLSRRRHRVWRRRAFAIIPWFMVDMLPFACYFLAGSVIPQISIFQYFKIRDGWREKHFKKCMTRHHYCILECGITNNSFITRINQQSDGTQSGANAGS